MAEMLLHELRYDTNRWRIGVFQPIDHVDAVYLFVDTKHPDKTTGMFSTNSRKIPCDVFSSPVILRDKMQSLVDAMIPEIEALPPPTIEEAERLARL